MHENLDEQSDLKPRSVKLSGKLVKDAGVYDKLYHRSKPCQIEYWARNGKIAEENPDLPFSFIQQALESKAEIEAGEVTPYAFGVDSGDVKG